MRRYYFIAVLILISNCLNAQTTTKDILKKGIKIKLTEDGKNFAKIGLGSQIWARYYEFNQEVEKPEYGKPTNSDFDISLRRTFFNLYAKFDKFTMFSMVGVTSQPYNTYLKGSKKAEFFIYDMWASYKLADEHLSLGMGLNMFSGLSRYSSVSSSKALSADVPTIACPDITTTSQSGRNLGIFATGKFGKLDYRVSLIKPFQVKAVDINKEDQAVDINKKDQAVEYINNNLEIKSYITLQLWEKETHEMPSKTSTYIGEKKVLNFGIGFDYHPESTITFNNDGSETINDKLHLAADVFMDLPLVNGDAITFYTGIFKFDYGKNYYSEYGTMDTYRQLAEPQQGTGYAINSQIAYLLPTKGEIKIQPYYTFDYKNFEALNDDAFHHNFGANFFFAGHKAKFGVEYQLRPYFDDNKNFDSYKGMGILKMSFAI